MKKILIPVAVMSISFAVVYTCSPKRFANRDASYLSDSLPYYLVDSTAVIADSAAVTADSIESYYHDSAVSVRNGY